MSYGAQQRHRHCSNEQHGTYAPGRPNHHPNTQEYLGETCLPDLLRSFLKQLSRQFPGFRQLQALAPLKNP